MLFQYPHGVWHCYVCDLTLFFQESFYVFPDLVALQPFKKLVIACKFVSGNQRTAPNLDVHLSGTSYLVAPSLWLVSEILV
jgi:hypothetical protein